ncbi:MAG: ATP-binding protein [Bacteroidaceae bacterium]|nr:ATP-binding protein [Bacteroidaceae bacterium]
MKRDLLNILVKWRNSQRRKPLLVTGVRQCGKTYTLKEFGHEYFDNVCYINLESSSNYTAIFDYDFDVQRIVGELELLEQCKITPGKTLLILDEIQEVPRAITALKYFCENMRDLHVACAGSLLGIALKNENIAFPVGKVNRLQMYPMSFREFIIANGQEKYIELFTNWTAGREIPDVYARPLEQLLKEYYVVGGMPEVVQEYINTHNLADVQGIQDEILADYADDFSKHAPITEVEKIRLVWSSIPKQLAKENNKFVYSHVKEGKRSHELEAALHWLKNAGLVHLLELVQNAELPLSAFADATYFKVYMSDCGLLCRRLGLGLKDFLGGKNTLRTLKGAIVENFVMNELVSYGMLPYFWRSGNTAELDFIYEDNGEIVPVEVKSATNTQAKSYKLFCKKYQPHKGYKLSLKNLAVNNCEGTETTSLPLYLIWNI